MAKILKFFLFHLSPSSFPSSFSFLFLLFVAKHLKYEFFVAKSKHKLSEKINLGQLRIRESPPDSAALSAPLGLPDGLLRF